MDWFLCFSLFLHVFGLFHWFVSLVSFVYLCFCFLGKEKNYSFFFFFFFLGGG